MCKPRTVRHKCRCTTAGLESYVKNCGELFCEPRYSHQGVLVPALNKRRSMAQATSISLSKFTASVQAAVKAAAAKHPKFKVDPPHGISLSYLIRGFPIPDPILAQVTVSET